MVGTIRIRQAWGMGVRSVIMALLLIFSAAQAQAATWYIAPNGNDNAAGTSASPWLTPQRHTASYQPGDTIMVAAGTYNPANGWALYASGTPTNPITLQCAPNWTSIITPVNAGQNGIW